MKHQAKSIGHQANRRGVGIIRRRFGGGGGIMVSRG